MPAFENTLNNQGLTLLKIKGFAVNVPKKGGGEFGDFWGHGEKF
jgi:hypothetical protein